MTWTPWNCVPGILASRRRVGARWPRISRLTAKARGDRSAFTLIELMIVLVLIGILSAMILPEMKGTYGDALLRSSGRDLVNVFKLAYSRAVSLNQAHIVKLDEKTGHYVVERRASGRRNQTEFVPLKDVSGSAGDIDKRISIEIHKTNDSEPANNESDAQPAPALERERPSDNALTFYPDGTADAAEVLLRDRAGFGLRLRIDPITARVEILELTRE